MKFFNYDVTFKKREDYDEVVKQRDELKKKLDTSKCAVDSMCNCITNLLDIYEDPLYPENERSMALFGIRHVVNEYLLDEEA